MVKKKWIKDDLQNTTQKVKDLSTRTPLKTVGELNYYDLFLRQNFRYCQRQLMVLLLQVKI